MNDSYHQSCTAMLHLSRYVVIHIDYVFLSILFFFFFSSRRRHTRLQGDWSSDVCSSDLNLTAWQRVQTARNVQRPFALDYVERCFTGWTELHGDRRFADDKAMPSGLARSEERRVGKECRSRWSPYH